MAKKYVKVNADFLVDGRIIPRNIEWEDGSVFEVSKVYEVVVAASLKAGGVGLRYKCKIEGRDRYIFLEDCGKEEFAFLARWFVEVK